MYNRRKSFRSLTISDSKPFIEGFLALKDWAETHENSPLKGGPFSLPLQLVLTFLIEERKT